MTCLLVLPITALLLLLTGRIPMKYLYVLIVVLIAWFVISFLTHKAEQELIQDEAVKTYAQCKNNFKGKPENAYGVCGKYLQLSLTDVIKQGL